MDSSTGTVGLARAIIANSTPLTQYAIEGGAELDSALAGWHMLHLAAVHASSDIARLLVSCGIPVNERDENGRTPLHLAAAVRVGAADMVQFLLDKGADVNAVDRSGLTALDYAVLTHEEPAAVELLVKRGGRGTRHETRVVRDLVVERNDFKR